MWAKKMYIANVMTQEGETDGLNIADHVKAILNHCNDRKIVDLVIVNKEKIPDYLIQKYAKQNSESLYLTKDQRNELEKMKIKIIECDGIEKDADLIIVPQRRTDLISEKITKHLHKREILKLYPNLNKRLVDILINK